MAQTNLINKLKDARTLTDRLNIAKTLIGGPDALSKKSGIPRRTLGNYLSGRNEPKVSQLADIAEASGLRIEWLATGAGPAFDAAADLANRVRYAIGRLGGLRAAAKESGIREEILERLLTGRRYDEVDRHVCGELSAAAHLDRDWLIFGRGEAPDGFQELPAAPPSDRGRIGSQNDDALRMLGAGDAGDTESFAEAPREGFVYIPRYDIEASAGHGALLDRERVVDHLAFREDFVRRTLRADPAKLVLITGIGDSMEPTIRSGDLLLVDTGIDHFLDDAIYVVAIDGALYVKRIQRFFGGAVAVKSDNPAYVEQTLSPEEAASVRVAGRVRWIGRLI